MAESRLFKMLSIIILCFLLFSCTEQTENKQNTVFKQMPEIAGIKPQKPVKIKLKRNSGGKYSWELTGDNADKIIGVNRKLRKSLIKRKTEPK